MNTTYEVYERSMNITYEKNDSYTDVYLDKEYIGYLRWEEEYSCYEWVNAKTDESFDGILSLEEFEAALLDGGIL